MRFERITADPAQMGGVPCIRGLRIPVTTVVGLVAQGMTETRIVEEYPDLEVEDVRQALAFLVAAVDERHFPLFDLTSGAGKQVQLAAHRFGDRVLR